MSIAIDTTVTFDLPGDRHATVDALEIEEFIAGLWDTKGVMKPVLDGAGKPVLDGNGKPRERRELDWDIITSELAAWIKAQTGVAIKKSEAIAIWKKAPGVWAKKNASWDDPGPAPPDSPDSPPSSDPRWHD